MAPPVKLVALEMGLEVRQPRDHLELLVDLGEAAPDVAVVVAYGRILRAEALAVPDHGFVNVHFSLLPRWRGASPVVRAILAGDDTTKAAVLADWDAVVRPIANWFGVRGTFAGLFAVPVGAVVMIGVSLFTRAPSEDVRRFVAGLRVRTA